MIRQIAPQFFTIDLPATLAYYREKLGFDCVSTWQDPPVYAIVARDQHRIHFRCADAPTPNPDQYDDELLDAYVFVAGEKLVRHTIVGGELVVADGRHTRHDAITARYRKTIARLTASA